MASGDPTAGSILIVGQCKCSWPTIVSVAAVVVASAGAEHDLINVIKHHSARPK